MAGKLFVQDKKRIETHLVRILFFMYAFLPYLYAAAGILGLILLMHAVHLHFWVKVTADVLDARADFCAGIFGITLYCGAVTFEDGAPVLLNRRGIPSYIDVRRKKPAIEGIAEALHIPVVRRLRVRKISAAIEAGADDAYNTARLAAAAGILTDAAFTYVRSRDGRTLLRRVVTPVYGKNRIKISVTGIISMSLANIILSALQTARRGIKSALGFRSAPRLAD